MQRPEGTRARVCAFDRTYQHRCSSTLLLISRVAAPTKTRTKRMGTTRPLDTRSRSRSEETAVDRSSMRHRPNGQNDTRRNDTRAKYSVYFFTARYCDSSRRHTFTLSGTPPSLPPSRRVYPRNVVEFTLESNPRSLLSRSRAKRVPD